MNTIINFKCQACKFFKLLKIDKYTDLPRVTSDSKPFSKGGNLFVCSNCGLVQKIPDTDWFNEINYIYLNYDMYHQSASVDQTVFDTVTNLPRGRSEVLAINLIKSGYLPKKGCLLDVGAGSGAMLSAFGKVSNQWQLYGYDLDKRREESLATIPGFEKLFTENMENINQQFDLLTLIHSLEHFPNPIETLEILKKNIVSDGKIFIQVNNVEKMPFDLVVADHLCHFSPSSLSYLVNSAGYFIEYINTEWVNKEISMLISNRKDNIEIFTNNSEISVKRTNDDIAWLSAMLGEAKKYSTSGNFGIFGTSIAATWIASELGDKINFFVDEDPERKGRFHLNRPIITPNEIPENATIFLAFIPEVADKISKRLEHLNLKFVAKS